MDLNFNSKLEEYYQKFIELQEKLKRSEEQRFVLEMKFNEMVHVAKEEEQAHFRKLRSQYKKFLEEDRKRQERNERIIRNLERIETKITMLSAKTDRINMFRRQYQSYLRRMIANRNSEVKTSESRISRERSFIKEEPFKKQQPTLFRDDYSIPEKPKETLEEGKQFYGHPTVQKALEKDRSNEEKIEILDRYLQSISTQKCRDILDQERQGRENSSFNIPSNIYYKDDFFSNATNQAAAVADDIMNSIYSRYYSKPDMLSKENKDLELITQRENKNHNQDKGPKTEKNTPTVSFNPNTHDNKNIGNKKEYKMEDEERFNAGIPKSKGNEYISSLKNNEKSSERDNVKSPTIKREKNDDDEFNEILNYTDSIGPEMSQFNLDSGEKANPPFNFASISTENKAKSEIANSVDAELDDKLINSLPANTSTVQKSFEENENKFATMSNSNVDKFHSEIVSDKQENQQVFTQEEPQRNDQLKKQPQDQLGKDIIKNQTEKIHTVENKDENHGLDYTHNGNNQYDKNNQPQKQFSKDNIKNQPNQIQQVENKEESQGFIDQPYLNQRKNGHDNDLQNQSNNDVQEKIQKEQDHSSVEYIHPTDLHVKSDQPIGLDDNQLLLQDQNLAVTSSESNLPLQQYDASHGQPAQFSEMGPPLEYAENEPSYQQIQYDEHGQPIQYDQNIQPTGYDQYGQFLLYDENGQVVQPQYDENGQILPQYDVNGQIIMLYDQNGQPFFTDQYKSDPQQYDENGHPLLQYDENGQPVLQYDENGQPMYDQNQYYDYTNQGQTNLSNEYDQRNSNDQGPYHDTENGDNSGDIQNVTHENQIGNAVLNNQESHLDTDVGGLNDPVVNAGYKNQNDEVVLGDQEPYHDTEDGAANDDKTVITLTQNQDADIVDPYMEKSQGAISPSKNETHQYQLPTEDPDQVDSEKGRNVETISNDVSSKIEKEPLENKDQKGLKDNAGNKPTNVMDILDTDTESVKQNTSKVSNDSDFDFS